MTTDSDQTIHQFTEIIFNTLDLARSEKGKDSRIDANWTKTPSSDGPNAQRKDRVCDHCGKPGHIKKVCWKLKRERERERERPDTEQEPSNDTSRAGDLAAIHKLLEKLESSKKTVETVVHQDTVCEPGRVTVGLDTYATGIYVRGGHQTLRTLNITGGGV